MLTEDCNLRLDIEDTGVGDSEPLRGMVSVEVENEVDCDGLTITRHWRSEGAGITDEGGRAEQTLFEGTWKPGETHEYSFAMELPPGPYTDEGEIVSLKWHLIAEADIPWAIDPSAETSFRLEPGGRDRYIAGESPASIIDPRQPDAETAASFSVLACWVSIGMGGVLFVAAFVALGPAVDGLLAPTVFGLSSLMLVGLGLKARSLGMQNARAEHILGDVEFDTSTQRIEAGETLTVDVDIRPPESVELEELTFGIGARERARRTSDDMVGKRHRRYHERLSPDQSLPTTLSPGQWHTFSTDIEVPDDAGYTYQTENNSLEWLAGVEIEPAADVTWSITVPLLVRPRT